MKLVTDGEGLVRIRWPSPGMYWLNVTQGGGRGARAGQPAGTIDKPTRRTAYTATLEVLPQ
jgi:hypothetical protein